MTPPLNGSKWRTKEPFDESEEESEEVGLKFNIQKTKIMAYSPITSWQIDGETMEIVSISMEIDGEILFSWASKSLHMVTAATKLKDAWSLEEKLWQI